MTRPLSALALLLCALSSASAQETQPYTFQREDVLGTSFRLTVLVRTQDEADRCQRAALETVEALRQVLSRWDPESELSKLNAQPWDQRQKIEVSLHLGAVLREGLRWRTRTQGVFDVSGGELYELWRAAAKRGEPPDAALLSRLAEQSSQGPGYKVTRALIGIRSVDQVTSLRPGRFDVDGIAKGYVVDQALRAVRREVATLEGALLDIGGDLRVWGNGQPALRAPWVIDVADPRESADNAEPLARIALRDRAVASSGGYARPLSVGEGEGQVAHIFDPRSGRPIEAVLGATAVAADAASADALATTLCVLAPAEGLRLADKLGAACAVVDRQGKVHLSSRWEELRSAGTATPWASEHQLQVSFRLVNSTPNARGKKGFKRHFMACWIEDAAGQRVRLLALWAKKGELKYVKGLKAFWKDGWKGAGGSSNPKAVRTWTRATRNPGEYTLAWDGTDDAGMRVPHGIYRVRIDINREHGPRGERDTEAHVEIECNGAPATAQAEDQAELADVKVRYGPKNER